MKLNDLKHTMGGLFTMSFAFNRDMEILWSSQKLQRLLSAATPGVCVRDIFDFHRPVNQLTFDDVLNQHQSLYLIISKDKKLALRGQIVRPSTAEPDRLVFVGSPWMSWMTENCPEVHLQLSDFPRHDSQMDHNFYVVTQQSMVRELEQINSEMSIATEAAKQAKQSQADFFAVMSHEMRTPLNGVISALGLIEGTSDSVTRDKLLDVASSSANNLLSVINYVLDFSKMDAGKLEVENSEFDLYSIEESVKDILSTRAKAKGIKFELEFDQGCPRMVVGDGDKIRQILINLGSNAVKFTDRGFVKIITKLITTQEDKVTIQFDVLDTGTGITAEEQPRIFDAFWTSKDQSSRNDANTGLGLNICQRLTSLMGGKLTYTSTLGEGSCFSLNIELLASKVEHKPEVPSTIEILEQTPASKPYSIEFVGEVLLVDDNQTNLLVCSMMLERMGLSVRTASDGLEALDIIAEVDFDLVLMDITMPEMDGETATRHIRKSGNSTPVIALTAHVGPDLEARYQKSGMQEVVHKPIVRTELVQVLSNYLPVKKQLVQIIQENDVNQRPTLDAATLLSLIDAIGETNFQKAYRLFLDETSRRVSQLLTAWIQRDMQSLSREAHTLSSSVASFGALAFGDLLKSIELTSASKDIPALVSLITQVETAHRESLDAFSQYLAGEPLNEH